MWLVTAAANVSISYRLGDFKALEHVTSKTLKQCPGQRLVCLFVHLLVFFPSSSPFPRLPLSRSPSLLGAGVLSCEGIHFSSQLSIKKPSRAKEMKQLLNCEHLSERCPRHWEPSAVLDSFQGHSSQPSQGWKRLRSPWSLLDKFG